MTYVIAGSCIKDDSCIEVCPVDCIHPKPGDPDFETAEQLYIDPEICIDCDACDRTDLDAGVVQEIGRAHV